MPNKDQLIIRPAPARNIQAASQPPALYEADVALGLENFALAELRAVKHLRNPRQVAPGVLQFSYSGGKLASLLHLTTVVAVYRLLHFAVPRPKALLGHEHLSAISDAINSTLTAHRTGLFQSFLLSAAGSESAVLARLKAEVAAQFKLVEAEDSADLLLRLRRPLLGAEGWEVLVRISPRPLQTRAWRICNLEGALNAPIASVIAGLVPPNAAQVYFNLACGSGTLLIERLALGPVRLAMGCDIDPQAISCTTQNLQAAGYTGDATLGQWDGRRLPLQAASVDVITADLPFGQLVGTHEHNAELYPALLLEAARVTKPGGHFSLISHEIRLMERLLDDASLWRLDELIRVNQGGLNPRIYHLLRV